jgi:hypothetical protein
VHWDSNASFASCYLSMVSEMLWNTPKHQFGSNGVEWMLDNFGTPKQCIQSRNTSFASFYLSKVSETLRNTTKHHFESNGDVSRLWYPEIVHWGSDASFTSFTCCRLTKCYETLPNINLGPMEMFHDYGTPKQCIQSGNISFASFCLSKVSEITLPNFILGPMEMFHEFGT